MTDPFLNNFFEPDEGAAANKEDLLRVNLNVFLVRVFTAALRRNVARAAFQNLQKSLLNAFARDITRYAHIISLATDLVDLVDVNDTDLRALHIVIGILQEAQNNILDIFTDVTCFGKRGRIGDAEWHIQNFRQRLGQQRFSRTGWTDQQDIALLNFNVG